MKTSMNHRPFNVLFLCTGNSARSIIAEALLNRIGTGRFIAHSAGSHPNGKVNPHAQELLQRLGYDTVGLRSKSWDEFAASGAPELDFVFTHSIAFWSRRSFARTSLLAFSLRTSERWNCVGRIRPKSPFSWSSLRWGSSSSWNPKGAKALSNPIKPQSSPSK
jgi:hypothetical protein